MIVNKGKNTSNVAETSRESKNIGQVSLIIEYHCSFHCGKSKSYS